MHITYSKKLITENILKVYRDDFEMFRPECTECKKELGLGDYIDGFFPYEHEYNICKECSELK